MRIKRLELNGFKSFPEKTVIPFPKGISGVVGPNGCGKSNIVDAIKWVMGEQSPKQLRGKGMDDVIFAGANNKGSVGMAEVSLVLENDNGHRPPEMADFSEVVITRRLFRDGESEYAINNQPCRLKDITHLFLDTGAGNRTYSVIEQGRVGAIIDSKAEDRRHWIEEAAGISKYKHRKLETLRKLELTQQNLLRVGDVVAEVRRQMNSLHRQAKKAERYREVRRELKEIELTLTAQEFRGLQQERGRLERSLDEKRGTLQELRAVCLEIERGLAGQTVNLEEVEEALRQGQERFYRQQTTREREELLRQQQRQEQQQLAGESGDIEREAAEIGDWLARVEAEARELLSDLETYNERLGLEEQGVAAQQETVARLKDETHRLQAAIETSRDRLLTMLTDQTRVRNRRLGLAQIREERRLRIARQSAEKNQLNERLEKLKALSAETEETLRQQERVVAEQKAVLAQRQLLKQAQEEQREQAAASMRDLERAVHEDRVEQKKLLEIQTSYQAYQNGVRALFQEDFFRRAEGARDPVGLLAQGLETEPGFEAAVEAALGEALQSVIVDGPEEALAGIQFLKTSGVGRATFIPIHSPAAAESLEPAAALNGYRPLLEKVTVVRDDLRGWLEKLLGGYLLVPNVEEGLGISGRGGSRVAAVTPEGDLVTPQGIISGGSRGPDESGILVQKNRLKRLEEGIREGEERIREARERLAEIVGEIGDTTALLLQDQEAIRTADKEIQSLEKVRFGYQEEAKPMQRRLEILAVEEEEIRSQMTEEDSQEASLQQEETRLEEEIQALKGTIQEQEASARSLEQQLEEGREVLSRLQSGYSAMREKGEHLNREWRRMEEALQDRRSRLGRHQERQAQIARLTSELESRLTQGEASLSALNGELEQLEVWIRERNQDRENILEEKGRAETALRERRQTLEEGEAAEKELRLQAAQTEMRLENLREKAREQFGMEPEVVLERPQPDPEETARLGERKQELRTKIDQMGEVNLVAIEEYQAFKERHDFYQAQEQDLQQSMDALRRAIQKINGTSREMFLEAFGSIQENMNRVFPILFGGGTAKLSLTNEEDPLEAGVDILVHPPGKKVTNMTLLSGGEKALTALAFIFSIYMVKPSPFCLLDEIDAFLDEANVERFKKFVQGLVPESQIIMVTHNRRIMEMADALYGVTMEQPGVSKLVSVRLDHIQN